MEGNFNRLIEKDAVPGGGSLAEVVSSSELLDYNENEQRSVGVVNNNTLMSQLNSTTMNASTTTFNGCNKIHIGTTINIGRQPSSSVSIANNKPNQAVECIDESVYKKTPTIKKLLASTEPITPAFLDNVSENFGKRWREITIYLKINQLFVDRMIEDYYDKGGTKEVVFQILSKHFKDQCNQGKSSTVGDFISLLWDHGFRRTVWEIKEHHKLIEAMKNDFDE